MEIHFNGEIQFKTIEIEAAREVVAHSFIVQKSLTFLDLSACEYSQRRKSVFTEEQCRKLTEPRRQILYRLNLDLPTRLESSLRSVTPSSDDRDQYGAFHLQGMFVSDVLCSWDLAIGLEDVILSSGNVEHKVKEYLKVMKLLELSKCKWTSLHLFDKIIPALCPDCSDSNLVVELAITFRFDLWLRFAEAPEVVRFVLSHAFKLRCDIWRASGSDLGLINDCILFKTPLNVTALLEFGTVLHFRPDAYFENLDVFLNFRLRVLVFLRNISDRRLFLMLQLFYYYYSFNEEKWEGLLYIWRSIPDYCLSEREIRSLFENALSLGWLRNMIEFYKSFIVEEREDIDDETPRPLLHLSRVTVRNAMIRCHQLPYGVSRLGKPKIIEKYINLEC